ncbi:outer membrane protein assembly factor BamD [Desulfurivibrio alkaliphilus]|uniref:Outer membrane assembly lipoprotein YfiO n=1 Tax=Desulfurivibrio alkaliphilus (strain DSM 19089 / UNIQEM U267 / AHT2) TaxID=589865 RepID=D6Z457_DESAT|nr:outer membrane protein assembly factor BamD [Desulfurivibrio alkaliphilus]ADH86332.1 outer membrane assembly lipoprotein YfiO [Desulfurivibrio alkaliphilus AHT 2]
MPLFQHPSARPTGWSAWLLTLLILLLLVSGCGTKNRDQSPEAEQDPRAPELLAMEGMEKFNQARYRQALEIFKDLKERYPFSSVGVLAELKAADATYYLRRYDEALPLYQEFENNHPTNEAIPYVMFQIGMCHYQRIGTIDRDPAHALNAIAAFTRLNRAFPDSPYRKEAEARTMAARDFMARHEMFIAGFYLNTKKYDQAERRLAYLIDNYPESELIPEAEEVLAALEAGNPPRRNWRDFVPDLSLGSWRDFIGTVSAAPGVESDHY